MTDTANTPTTDDHCDVCVVGGGPAGLTLALLLLKTGFRVTLVERSASLDRAYRGEILQPGGLALMDQLGCLTGALARGGYSLDRFQLVEADRVLLDIDYGRLPPPHTSLLSIPQDHVLAELLGQCRRFDTFHELVGHRVTELVTDGDGGVRGVVATGRGRRRAVHAACVVGADGRYSKTRRLAGIETDRIDAFAFDVLWLKLPLPPGRPRPHEVRVFRSAGSPVLVYPSYPGTLQIGWTLPHKGYAELAARGVAHVRDEICRAIPGYADLVHERIVSLGDLTLLDVFAGRAQEWARDGLVLIGDSAHTHSPLGAQGINLALQDAALLHPVLTAALRAGDVTADRLAAYAKPRSRDIAQVMKVQHIQAKAMLSQGRVARAVRPRLASFIQRTPVGSRITRLIAHGNPQARVRTDLFGPGVPTAS